MTALLARFLDPRSTLFAFAMVCALISMFAGVTVVCEAGDDVIRTAGLFLFLGSALGFLSFQRSYLDSFRKRPR